MNFQRQWLPWGLVLLFGAAAFIHIPTFFGIDFVIGSTFTYILLRLYGLRYAAVHAAIFAVAAYTLWGHAFGSIAFFAEFLAVAWFFKRGRAKLVMTVMLYWLLFGAPFIFLTYLNILGLSWTDALNVSLKDTVNAVFCALIANIIVFAAGIFRSPKASVRLETILFNTILAFFLVPTLSLFVYESIVDFHNAEARMEDRTTRGLAGVANELNTWLQDVARIASIQGSVVYEPFLSNEELTRQLQTIDESIEGITEVEIIDREGALVSGYPATRDQLAGSDMMPEAVSGMAYALSPFLTDRSTGEPYVTMITRLDDRTVAAEDVLYLRIALDMDAFKTVHDLGNNASRISGLNIADESGMLLYSPSTANQEKKLSGVLERMSSREELSFLWRPDGGKTKISDWDNAYFVKTSPADTAPWNLVVSVAAKPYKDELFTAQLFRLSMMVVVMTVIILLSSLISKMILRPVNELMTITDDLPVRVQDGQTIAWPKTQIEDVSRMVQSFRGMTETLSGSFQEVKAQQAELERLAASDSLTGLANRLGIEREYRLWQERYDSIGLLFLDLDHFKGINDTLGHAAGDEVLVEVARRLDQSKGAPGFIGRLGGDEFIVLVPAADESEVERVASGILEAFVPAFWAGGQRLVLSPSIGMTVASRDVSFAVVAERADVALYESKESGRNRATVYGKRMA